MKDDDSENESVSSESSIDATKKPISEIEFPLETECDFYFTIPFSYSFKNYIEICKKINKEIQMILYKKSGIIFFNSNLSTKQVIIETIFNKECFTDFFCNESFKLLSIDLNSLFKVIKNVKKGNSIQFIKYKDKPFIKINIMKNSQILIQDELLFFKCSGKKHLISSTDFQNFSFSTKDFNTELDEILSIDEKQKLTRTDDVFFLDSLFFSKFVSNLCKKKLNKIKFSFYKEGYFTIETKCNSFNAAVDVNNVIIIGDKEKYSDKNESITEVDIPNNIFYFFTKVKNISSEGSIIKLKPISKKSFVLETYTSGIGLFRVVFRNK